MTPQKHYIDDTVSRDHEIYNQFSHSFQNIIVSCLIKVLHNYGICNDINIPAAAVSSTEHFVPKMFTSSFTEALKSPSFQSKFYRHSSCFIFVSVGIKYTQYDKAERKQNKFLKRKESNLLISPKLHGPF